MIVPDGIEPIVAWRSWNLNTIFRSDPAWASLDLLPANHAGGDWKPGSRYEARCLRSRSPTAHDPVLSPAPDEGCSCGIYALKPEYRGTYLACDVQGEVWLWGKVIEAEKGYRAQYAYPKLLVIPKQLKRERHRWAEAWGCEVEVGPRMNKKYRQVRMATQGAMTWYRAYMLDPSVRPRPHLRSLPTSEYVDR